MKKVFGTITLNVMALIDENTGEMALLKANDDFSEPYIEDWNIEPISVDGTVHSLEVLGYKSEFTHIDDEED